MRKKYSVSREDLYEKYIVENLSRSQCADFFNAPEGCIKNKIKEYGFRKSKEQISKILSNSQKIQLDKDTLIDLYLVNNLTLYECANVLGVQPHTVKRRLQDFGIKKPQDKFKEIHKKHAHQTKESLEKRKSMLMKKYGVDNVSKIKEIQNRKELTTKKHYGVDNPFQAQEIKDKISSIVQEKYGVPYSCMREECRKYSGNDSKPNQEFAALLDKYGIEYQREFPLENYSYDFKVGNMLFEINPSIFHNYTISPVGLPKSKKYHLEKKLIASKYGYHCVHVFDWDDPEKIVKVFLLNKERVYARKCELKPVPVQEARQFLEENHLQGYAKDEIRLGLYYNNTLVEIMTFAKPRYNKNYNYELVRLCAIKNVVGGAEKLLTSFMETYKGSIISYCDIAKFEGKTYTDLGFKCINKPQPSKHWVSLKTGQHITDNLLRQKGFDQLFKTNYGKGTSNEQLMLEYGFVEVYDCGQLTYVLL